MVTTSDSTFNGAVVIKDVIDTTHFTYVKSGSDQSTPITGVTLLVPFAITLDTTTVPGRFKISGGRVTLTVGTRTFSSALSFEAMPDGVGGRPVVVSVSGLSTTVTSGATALLDVTNGSGTFILSTCLLYTSPSPRDGLLSRMPSSA